MIETAPTDATGTAQGAMAGAPVDADLAPWLDGLLRRGSGVSIVEDSPLLFDAGDPRVLRCTLRDDAGRPSAHAAARLLEWEVRETPSGGAPRPAPRRLTIAVVGAVASEPRLRGRGFATRAVSEVIEAAHARGAHVAVLWSEADALYARLGFAHAGSETTLVATADRISRPALGAVRPFRADDLDAVARLHDAEPRRIVRDRATWRRLLAVPRLAAYVLERDGAVHAFGVVGRGADLGGCLHTVGGDEHMLVDLAGGILALRDAEELFVLLPPWKRRARAAFLLRGCLAQEGPACMARALRPGVDPAGLWFSGLDSM
ncbi:MAG TPA: GNAT family N-acetyltransferase [Planctomycetota bacterium]|nr:GNAT family N-acetyltransferase [Planctomycetota bacterium]